MKKFIKNQKGFSLLELLIYVAVLSIVTVVVAQGFLILSKGRAQVEARNEVNNNLRFAVEKIKREVASATSLNVPAVAGTTLANLDLNIAGRSIKYSLSNGKLLRQVDSAPLEAISSSDVTFSSLNFTRLENINSVLGKKMVSVQISVTANYNSLSPDWQINATQNTTENLRQDF